MYPIVIDRLRGAPARLEVKTAGIEEDRLTINPDGWSVKNQIGHLIMVEMLWEKRLEDFRENRNTLFAADYTLSEKKAPDHNPMPVAELLKKFRMRRAKIIVQFEQFSVAESSRSATHPRLNIPIRLIDHALFIAEHDDHHLAKIQDLIQEYC